MGKRKGTPDDLDYLFERNVIDEDDYAAFWAEYWAAPSKKAKDAVVREWTEIAADLDNPVSVGVVTRNKADAAKQAQSLNDLGNVAYKVVRRNARGQFSKRGTYYQAVKK
jgi:predicted urease superfamily metal-dependent hydrolase